MERDVTVVIPCWIIDNTLLQLTHRCVQSIRETSDVNLILIDNGSKLWSDYLTDEADVLIKNSENLGYVKAINQGFAVARTKYIVAGNNDFTLVNGWVEAMKEVLELPYAGIACLKTTDNTLKRDNSMWIEHGTPGGWWMITRYIFEQVGLLDEQFFNTYADMDYCWRLKKKGKEVVCSSKVTIEHYGEASLEKFLNRKDENDSSKSVMTNKWFNDVDFKEYMKLFGKESEEYINEFSKSV